MTAFAPLPYTTLPDGMSFRRPPQRLPDEVQPDDPAVSVMTDLDKVAAVTIGRRATIEQANQKMIASGVRLLLVTDEHNDVQGLITSRDILGEKPMLYMQRMGGTRDEILVEHIMTPRDELEVLHWVDVLRARVGDVVATLKHMGRQHALVVDVDEYTRRPAVRGIFSATQIGKQLGVQVEPAEIAKTFAELESAIAAPA
ncbi:CBS domain-containing protein [Ectothiorhodospiraceae bacterium 2226]|nr:CBS domain-containing protein [Ectothiorhodospiraceae bacterium 2226]